VALTVFCIRLAANSGSSPNTADDLRQMSTEQCNGQWDAFTAPVNVLLENVSVSAKASLNPGLYLTQQSEYDALAPAISDLYARVKYDPPIKVYQVLQKDRSLFPAATMFKGQNFGGVYHFFFPKFRNCVVDEYSEGTRPWNIILTLLCIS
jgi:hypothetical protein